jgi:hypothetical protein
VAAATAVAAPALATADARRTAELEVQLATSRAREAALRREVALLRRRHASAAAAEARVAGVEREVALLRPRHASAVAVSHPEISKFRM